MHCPRAIDASPMRAIAYVSADTCTWSGSWSAASAGACAKLAVPCNVAHTNSASSSITSRGNARTASACMRTKPSRRRANACCALAIIAGCCDGSGSGVPNIKRYCSGRARAYRKYAWPIDPRSASALSPIGRASRYSANAENARRTSSATDGPDSGSACRGLGATRRSSPRGVRSQC